MHCILSHSQLAVVGLRCMLKCKHGRSCKHRFWCATFWCASFFYWLWWTWLVRGSGSHATTSSGTVHLNVVYWKDRYMGKFCMVHVSVICCHLVSSHVLVEIATLWYEAPTHRTQYTLTTWWGCWTPCQWQTCKQNHRCTSHSQELSSNHLNHTKLYFVLKPVNLASLKSEQQTKIR
jgi:hypothetical protein